MAQTGIIWCTRPHCGAKQGQGCSSEYNKLNKRPLFGDTRGLEPGTGKDSFLWVSQGSRDGDPPAGAAGRWPRRIHKRTYPLSPPSSCRVNMMRIPLRLPTASVERLHFSAHNVWATGWSSGCGAVRCSSFSKCTCSVLLVPRAAARLLSPAPEHLLLPPLALLVLQEQAFKSPFGVCGPNLRKSVHSSVQLGI